MHPIVFDRQRLTLYLVAWLPIAGLVTAVLAREGTLSWVEAAVVAFPMCAEYAFMCLASWYVCRAVPLRQRTTVRVVATLGVASLFSCLLWLVTGSLWVAALENIPSFAGLSDRYLEHIGVLFPAGILLFLLAALLHYLLLLLEESKETQKRALELQVLAREAELKALRAQIDPHFLFNSLNSISALTAEEPAGARRMCLLLAEFLRSSLRLGARERIPFADEMKLAESFLNIEKIRFGDRLRVEQQVDPECDDCLVPPLLIQPLIENAVRHGIAPLIDGGVVKIEAQRHGKNLEIVLENPFDPEAATKDGAGVGLKNVQARVRSMFADDGRVEVEKSGGRFRIMMRMPCVRAGTGRMPAKDDDEARVSL